MKRKQYFGHGILLLGLWSCGTQGVRVSTDSQTQQDLVGTTYYVSPTGNDNNSGLSGSPWQTLARVNAQAFTAGDSVILAGNNTYTGSINLSNLSGTAASPITFTSDSAGVATISSGTSVGVSFTNSSGIVLNNLKIVGSGATSNNTDGVLFQATSTTGGSYNYIRALNLEVTGYGKVGIDILSTAGVGFNDVQISNCVVHDIKTTGITTYYSSMEVFKRPHQNIRVDHCVVYNITGDSTVHAHTGDGILLGEVERGVMEYNLVYNCGTSNINCGGPAGIWTYESNEIIIQFNEVHHMSQGTGCDGDAYDLDGGTTNSIIQYNYSHDNDGAGVLVCDFSGSNTTHDNIVRYNVSQNDGRKGNYGAITFWASASSQVYNILVHNNSIYMTTPTTGTSYGIDFQASVPTGVNIANNIFYVTGTSTVLAQSESTMSSSNANFVSNDYFTNGTAFSIKNGSSTYTSFSAWQSATGQEMIAGSNVGLTSDPNFVSPGGGPTINNSNNIMYMTAYQLNSGSPMQNHGVNVASLFNSRVGTRDFWDNTAPDAGGTDVGAYEINVAQQNIPGSFFNENAVVNPSAEDSNSTAWTLSGPQTASIYKTEGTSHSHTGQNVLLAYPTLANTPVTISQTISLGAGNYEATGWYHTWGTTTVSMIKVLDAAGTLLAASGTLDSTSYPFVSATVPFSLSGNGNQTGIILQYVYQTSYVTSGGEIDDLRVQQQQKTNLLANPGAESLNASWTFNTGASTKAEVFSKTHTGSEVFLFYPAATGTPATISQLVSGLSAGNYEVSVFYHTWGSTQNVYLQAYDTNNTQLASTSDLYYNGSAYYAQVTLPFSLSGTGYQTGSKILFTCSVTSLGSGCEVDDFQLLKK